MKHRRYLKKMAAVLLAFAMLVVGIVGNTAGKQAAAATTGTIVIGGVTYSYDSDSHTCSVTDYSASVGGTSVTILYAVPVDGVGYIVTSIGDYAFYNCSGLTSIEIPAGVTSIGDHAFYNCSGLTSIEIPEGVTSIGNYAFYECSSLTSIEISEGVTSIGNDAFSYCSSLISIRVAEGNQIYDSRNDCNAIIETSTSSLVIGCKNTIIPEGVTSIGFDAFVGCKGLISIEIPEGVTSIGDSAFRGCSSLTSIEISEGVTNIGDYAFSFCSSLTSVEIPEGVTGIGVYAFWNCSSLTSITIPDSVVNISYSAFNDCNDALIINCKEGSYAQDFARTNGILYLILTETIPPVSPDPTMEPDAPAETENPEDPAEDSFSFTRNGIVYEYSRSTGTCSVTGFTASISSYVTIPSSLYFEGDECVVTAIEDFAFYDCIDLQQITIPDTVKSIGVYAFYSCTSLTEVTLPNGITSIKEDTFCGCSQLTEITIPDSVTSIGYEAFDSCSSLVDIIIPNSVTSIDAFAFWHCSSLESIIIPDSVDYIGAGVFSGCSELTIYCSVGSVAADYAEQQEIAYSYLADDSSPSPDDSSPSPDDPDDRPIEYPGITPTPRVTPTSPIGTPSNVPSGTTALPIGTGTTSSSGNVTSAPGTSPTVSPKASASPSPSAAVEKMVTVSQLSVSGVSAKSAYKKSGYKQTAVVKVTWSKNTLCSGYQVKRKSGSNGKYSVVKTISKSGTVSYTDTSVKKGVKYTYCICAYAADADGETITGKNSSAASLTVSKKVVTPQISAKKKGSKMVVTFKKAEGSTYQFQYRFPGGKKWGQPKQNDGNLKKKVTINNVSSSGFQIRVRTRMVSKGKIYYSGWSKAVTVK